MGRLKAQLTFVFVFIVASVILVSVSAVFAPMMVLFNAEMYAAGDDILNQANSSINNISDATIKAEIQAAIGQAQDATQTNIDVGTDLFQYGWVLLLILLAVIIYLIARQNIEFSGRGFV